MKRDGKNENRSDEVRRRCTARNKFSAVACARWVRENHPRVFAAIRAKSYEKWPLLGYLPRHRSAYDFVSDISSKVKP